MSDLSGGDRRNGGCARVVDVPLRTSAGVDDAASEGRSRSGRAWRNSASSRRDARFKASTSDGFSLIEVLVALVVFAAMAAITWGALGQVVRTRTALDGQQQRFAAIVRAVGDLERDLRQAVSRPIRGQVGEALPAVLGDGSRLELSRIGFANPRVEQQSQVERVGYRLEDGALRRERWPVLDRAAGSRAESRELLDRVESLQLRYLGDDGNWRDAWPPRDVRREQLPRAVEWRLKLAQFGELRRVIALPSSAPERAAEAGVAESGGPASPIVVTP